MRNDPAFENAPAIKSDAVIVPHTSPYAGVYVRPGQNLSPRAAQRVAEITAGRARYFANLFNPHGSVVEYLASNTLGGFKIATDDEWAFVIGLAVVGQAERVEL